MVTGNPTATNFSPSAMSTFEDCAARDWHGRHDDGSGLLPTDPIPAAVGSALHEGFMVFHRDMEGRFINGALPTLAEAETILFRCIDRALFKARLDPSMPGVAERLRKAHDGIRMVAAMAIADMPRWARDERTGVLVWTEARLDHGPLVRAVELEPGVLSATKPDVIGIRNMGAHAARVVVKDYKARNSPVDPEFDNGILLRGIWAMLELQDPRCVWFVANRNITIDRKLIDIETVNVMHAGTPEFFIQRTLSIETLDRHRDRLVALSSEMANVNELDDPASVPATPGFLCEKWCSYLHRCATGQAHLRKYAGDERLSIRLQEIS